MSKENRRAEEIEKNLHFIWRIFFVAFNSLKIYARQCSFFVDDFTIFVTLSRLCVNIRVTVSEHERF